MEVWNEKKIGRLVTVPRLFRVLYDTRHYDRYCSLITRLDEHEMQDMRREDAGNYLNMVAEKERLRFTYPAQQALIRVALCTNIGGIVHIRGRMPVILPK